MESPVLIPIAVKSYRDNLRSLRWPEFVVVPPRVGDFICSLSNVQAKILQVIHREETFWENPKFKFYLELVVTDL